MSMRNTITSKGRTHAVISDATGERLYFTGGRWTPEPTFHLRTHAREIARTLRARGHKVRVIGGDK